MTLSSRDQLCVREKAGALQAGELLSALQNCFAGLDKAAARVNREPGCTAAKLAHDTWVCSWLCVMERAAELVETERFPQQAVVGAIRDGLRSWPAAAQSLLQQHSAEALQSPSALPLLLHSLPVAAACAQAAFLSAAVNLLPSSRGTQDALSAGEEYPLSPLAISNLRQYLIQALSQHPSRECTKEAQSPNCTGDGSAGHSVMCRGLSAPAASQASATAHMLGGRDRPKPPALKFNPLRKKPGNISGLHMESSVTAESQDPKAATAEQVPAASQQDDLAAAVAGVARCIMTDLLEPARLIGWLGLQQPQASPTKTAAAEGQEGAAAEVEHSKGLLEVLSALGGKSASPVAARGGKGANTELPHHDWKDQGKLVQQLVLVLLQILTLHHEVASEMLKKRWHGSEGPSSGSQSTSPSAGSSPMPTPTRPHHNIARAQPSGSPGAAAPAPSHNDGAFKEARRKAAVDLLMLHACLSKLLLPPQAGSLVQKLGHTKHTASQAGAQPALPPATHLPAACLPMLSTWASSQLQATAKMAAGDAAPAPRRRSGRQVPHAYVSKQPEATVKAAIPISAADAALSLTLAHLKHVMNGRDQMQHKTGGLGRAQIDMDRLNVTEAAQMAWQVYSQCVEAMQLGAAAPQEATLEAARALEETVKSSRLAAAKSSPAAASKLEAALSQPTPLAAFAPPSKRRRISHEPVVGPHATQRDTAPSRRGQQVQQAPIIRPHAAQLNISDSQDGCHMAEAEPGMDLDRPAPPQPASITQQDKPRRIQPIQMSRQIGVFANVLDKAAEKDEQDWECFIAEKEHLVKYILQESKNRDEGAMDEPEADDAPALRQSPAGARADRAANETLPVQLSRAVAPPKPGHQPQPVALHGWQSLATMALRVLSACISSSLQGKRNAEDSATRLVKLVGKLASVEQQKAAARSACLRVDPCISYNKAQAAVRGAVQQPLGGLALHLIMELWRCRQQGLRPRPPLVHAHLQLLDQLLQPLCPLNASNAGLPQPKAGGKKNSAISPACQLSELLQVMLAYNHLPTEGLAPGALKLLLPLVMHPLGPQASTDLCSGYLWFLSQHLLTHLQAARSPLQPGWTRDIQLDASNTQWLQSLPATTQAFTASWLLQHLTANLYSLSSPNHAEPDPLPAAGCSLPAAHASASICPSPTQFDAANSSENIPSSSQSLRQVPNPAAAASPMQAAADRMEPAVGRWADLVDGLAAAANRMQAAVHILQAAARGSRNADARGQPAAGGLQQPTVGGFRTTDVRGQPEADQLQGAAVGGPAASGLGESVQDERWQQLAREWQVWHEDVEEWAESCCPAAEAIVSTAHAIAESRPDAESDDLDRSKPLASAKAQQDLWPAARWLQSSCTWAAQSLLAHSPVATPQQGAPTSGSNSGPAADRHLDSGGDQGCGPAGEGEAWRGAQQALLALLEQEHAAGSAAQAWQASLQEEMATAIDAACSLLDGKPATGQAEDECRTDDETDSESEADEDGSDADAAGPARAAPVKAGGRSSNAYVRAALAEVQHTGRPRRCCDTGADLDDFIVCASGKDYGSLFANHFVYRSDEDEDE
ncbi:hypothetical protein WJX74_000894 [Apatococcus lobatus]|uniref:Uncharacterized protein n=1 Tax=Apatococcus lobatus TaxID=904363 RepID=A0AAW1RL37_9CHLO